MPSGWVRTMTYIEPSNIKSRPQDGCKSGT
jgi:hypothetical protein